MPTASPFRIPIGDLLRRPGASRPIDVAGPLADLAGRGAQIVEDRPVRVDGTLERVSDGIVARGTIRAAWAAMCSRCLAPVAGELAVHVDELFERRPLAGETYQLGDDALDLEPLVRDALALELPDVPRCRDDCAGLCPVCGADRNVSECACDTSEPDPRWAALRSLDL